LRLQENLKKLNVPYSYGWSIVALTLVVKLATFPLTKKQVGPGQLGKHDRQDAWVRMQTDWQGVMGRQPPWLACPLLPLSCTCSCLMMAWPASSAAAKQPHPC
jgi:hypothetical protein